MISSIQVRVLLSASMALLLLAGLAPRVQANVLPDTSQTHITEQIEYLEDPSGTLVLQDVLEDRTWQRNGNKVFNQGYNASTWWLRFSYTNSGETLQSRLLSISYPVLRDVQVHLRSPGGPWQSVQMGNNYPFDQRPIDHRFFVVPIDWAAGETIEVYIRVKSSSSVQVPVELWKPEAFYSHSSYVGLAQGAYVGALAAIVAFNFLLFLSLRDPNYLYYVGTVVCMILLISSINGYTFALLWPDATTWNNQATVVFMALTAAFAGLFTRRFLELERSVPWLSKVMSVVILVAFCGAGSAFVLPYATAVAFLIPFTVVSCTLAIVCGLFAWHGGQASARFYLMAWTFLLVGLITLTLSKAGVLPSNALTDSAGQIGSLFEVILLSFALAHRINIERRLRYAAQAEILESSRRHNQQLETRVQARTDELEKLNERLNELSVTDSLTGLRNRRFFDETLEQELQRSQRTGRPLSVAMLDIDHFKKLNDQYGHQAGDECLVKLGQVLHSSVRAPTDTAARYGGEEFVLVLAETESEAALAVLERIRTAVAQLEVPWQGTNLSFTISIGLATAGPGSELQRDRLLKRADEALYRAKDSGRNRVCVAAETDNAAVVS